MVSLSSLAALPWFGRLASLVCWSVMPSFSPLRQARQDLGRRGLGGHDARRDAEPVVGRAAHREPGHRGYRGAHVAYPIDVANGVLRQRAAPALDMPVHRAYRHPDRVREVLEGSLHELVVRLLEHGLLAMPTDRAPHHQQVVAG